MILKTIQPRPLFGLVTRACPSAIGLADFPRREAQSTQSERKGTFGVVPPGEVESAGGRFDRGE